MLRNYLRIALRNLRRHALYSTINIVGLAVGLALCLLIFLYVQDEFSFDRFHANVDRIHRVLLLVNDSEGGVAEREVAHPMPLGPALESEFAQVETSVRLFEWSHFLRRGETAIEEDVLYADPSIFDVFSFPLVRGQASTALTDLFSVVLSETAARKYFGPEDPVGKTIEIRMEESFETFTVTGVAADVPPNSTIQFDVLASFAQLPVSFWWMGRRVDNWRASSFQTYVMLDAATSRGVVQDRFPEFRKSHYPDEEASRRSRGLWEGNGPPIGYGLQPLSKIHLTSSVPGGQVSSSDPMYSYILGAIAIAMLLIACINFTTLSIGRSASRAQEVGVRRVSGAVRGQLFAQFWGEALLLTLFAVVAGILLASLFLPVFNSLAGKATSLASLAHPLGFGIVAALTAVTALAAGAYPALVLSGLKPVETLKSGQKLGGTNLFTRSLVVGQFTLSIFLIISTLLMREQLGFVQERNLGFDKEHLVVVPTQEMDGRQLLERMEHRLAGSSEVISATGTSSSFNRGYSRIGFTYKGDEHKDIYTFTVAPDYVDVMGMDLVAGRLFDERRAEDRENGAVVNEALVRDFGWAEPLGQQFDGYASEESGDPDPVVIGIVRDFNYRSLHEEVEPMLLSIGDVENFRHLVFRLAPGQASTGLGAIESAWEELAADVPFQYSFVDEDLDEQYRSEQQWSRIVGYASLFAILIAAMGLFGLAALTVAGRTKEIGIRKVLGASVASVTALLSARLVAMVAIAFVAAVPAAYLVIAQWLETFAYRIDVSRQADVFVVAGVAAVGIALLSVSYQAVRAALANPADSLRYE